LHVCKSVWPGVATLVNYGKTWIAVARAPCGYERLSSGLNTFDHFISPTPHTPLTFPSVRSALILRRASYAQPDDRVWPRPQRSSTVHHRRRRRSRLSSPICCPHLLAVLDVHSNPTIDPYASICPSCPGSSPLSLVAMPALLSPPFTCSCSHTWLVDSSHFLRPAPLSF